MSQVVAQCTTNDVLAEVTDLIFNPQLQHNKIDQRGQRGILLATIEGDAMSGVTSC